MEGTNKGSIIEKHKKNLFSEDQQTALDAADHLAKIGGEDVFRFLIGLLERKESGIRNRAALALERLKDDRAVKPLLDAIQKKENHNYNGTMVFALESLDCSKKIVEIFRILFEETYEAKMSSNAILEKQEFEYHDADYAEILRMWKYCKNNKGEYPGFDDEETYEMMKENFELFEQTVKGK